VLKIDLVASGCDFLTVLRPSRAQASWASLGAILDALETWAQNKGFRFAGVS
jgi:hypothetical protein